MRFSELAEILERTLGADAARLACEAICREAQGEQVHIPRRAGRPEIRPDDTPAAVQVRYQVCARTARNWVNRWRS